MIDLYGNEISEGDIVMVFNISAKTYGFAQVFMGSDRELRLSWGGGVVSKYLQRNNANWQFRKVLAKPSHMPLNIGVPYRDLPNPNV